MTGALALTCGMGSRTLTVALSSNSVRVRQPSTVSQAVLVTASGGSGSYTYAWSQVGYSADVWTITSPTAANTTFSCGSGTDGSSADFMCLVTSGGASVPSSTVTAFIISQYAGGFQ